MAFKESEAGTKWCPMVRHEGDAGGSFGRGTRSTNPTNKGGDDELYRCNCLGSACAAWAYTREPVLQGRFNIGYQQAAEILGDDVSSINELRLGHDPQAYRLAMEAYVSEAIKNPLLQNVGEGWSLKSISIDEEDCRIIRVAVRDKDPGAMGQCGLART